MKKISLKNLNLKEVEQLSREQLRDVLGGWTGGTSETGEPPETGEEHCEFECKCEDGTSKAIDCVGLTTEVVLEECLDFCS